MRLTPLAINDFGEVVGFASGAGRGTEAFVHRATGTTLLGKLPGHVGPQSGSVANDINDAGQIVGKSWPSLVPAADEAFVFTPGQTMQGLAFLAGSTSEALCIDNPV